VSSPPPIFVTQPALPPLEELIPYLERIWESKWVTNAGPLHVELEVALAEYLGVEYVALFNNGTIALLTALKALNITGDVITTPFSFVATSHGLLWNNLRPVFVDIEPEWLNLDVGLIESAITPETSAILPVHCYGNPCDLERVQQIADSHGLRVIYDAAHAFGVRREGRSLLRAGDLSVLSFHGTKVFTTFEGGAIVCQDAEMKRRIDLLKNFGFADEVTVLETGINGKMNEFQAALGILQLRHMEAWLASRRRVDERYRYALDGLPGIRCLGIPEEVAPNYSYFPVLIGPEFPLSRDELYGRLRDSDIFARRYFYPLISSFPMYRHFPSAKPSSLPNAVRLAEQVLCLPIYAGLDPQSQDRVVDVITAAAAGGR
jgi:dTDP-4-amino-4,6-dideoxygalactose transaminase